MVNDKFIKVTFKKGVHLLKVITIFSTIAKLSVGANPGLVFSILLLISLHNNIFYRLCKVLLS